MWTTTSVQRKGTTAAVAAELSSDEYGWLVEWLWNTSSNEGHEATQHGVDNDENS